MVSSQSDQYRRLFSGTLGLLPVVFSNRALGGTLVHFLQECPFDTSAAAAADERSWDGKTVAAICRRSSTAVLLAEGSIGYLNIV